MNMYTNSGKIIDYVLVRPIPVPSFCPTLSKLSESIPLAPGVCAALNKAYLLCNLTWVTELDSARQFGAPDGTTSAWLQAERGDALGAPRHFSEEPPLSHPITVGPDKDHPSVDQVCV